MSAAQGDVGPVLDLGRVAAIGEDVAGGREQGEAALGLIHGGRGPHRRAAGQAGRAGLVATSRRQRDGLVELHVDRHDSLHVGQLDGAVEDCADRPSVPSARSVIVPDAIGK